MSIVENKEQQVKSKKRVADHGEVFTNQREVNAMLDLVKDQTERIEATFLEPACGDGNFLIEILRRKLNVIKSKYSKSRHEYNSNLIKVVCSIYGVELLMDNTNQCIERLYKEIQKTYLSLFENDDTTKQLFGSVRFVLNKNIICGNALNYTTNDGEPIVFTEWKFINDTDIKQRCFDYEVVLDKGKQTSLFADDDSIANIPEHGKEYPPIHYLKLGDNE